MKHIAVIILSVLLAASVVGGAVLYNRHQDNKAALTASEEKRSELLGDIKQMEQYDRSQRQRIDALEQSLRSAETHVQSLKSDASSKDKRIARLEREKRGIEDRLSKVIADYEARLADKRKELKVAHQQSVQKEETLKELQGAYLKAQETGEALRERAVEMNDNISKLKKENRELGAKFSSLNASYQNLVIDLEELKRLGELIPVLEESILMKEQSLSRLTERLTELQAQYEEQKVKKNELSTALSKKNGQVSELSDKLNRVQGELRRLEAETQECNEKTARLEDELNSLKHEKAVAEEKTARLQARHAHLLTNIEELEKSRGRMIELEEVVVQKNKQIAALEADIGALKAQISQLHQIIAEDKEFMARLKRRQMQLKQEKALKETQLGRLKSTYDALILDLKQEIADKEVTIETYQKKISVSFVDRILFDFAKASISPEGRSVLKRVGDILKMVKDRTIRVVGHTDDVPISREFQWKYPSNWELSAARAASVIRYLQSEVGLKPENMEAVGRAFYDPVADNESEAGRAQNRRVNIIIGPAVHAQWRSGPRQEQ